MKGDVSNPVLVTEFIEILRDTHMRNLDVIMRIWQGVSFEIGVHGTLLTQEKLYSGSSGLNWEGITIEKENGKIRRGGNGPSRKQKDKREKIAEPLATNRASMDTDDGVSYKVIGGLSGNLLEQNAQAMNQISANISVRKVEYYGLPVNLKTITQISTPDSSSLLVQPYDKSSLKVIEKAVVNSNLGLTPSNDDEVIRLSIPQLTAARRKELSKIVAKQADEGKVAIRNIRRDAIKSHDKLEKEKKLSEDNVQDLSADLQKVTDEYMKKIESIFKQKEKDVEVRFAMRDDRFAGYGHVDFATPEASQEFWLEEDDDVMPPSETAQPGFHFGAGDVSVPSGGFSFN
ncbi:hypothetical protein L1887_15133 [Cichorium endivia]|nr:hypothetical protein L1887_15133 [Cichorium endivia]